MNNKLTTWEVLRNKFPSAECVLLEEVSDASGSSRSRSLDFMAVNLWQSRGLSITGIERKSNRGDWLKELKTPEKQENHFKFCDYFYLLTDKEGVAKIEEIPETWGWYHINETGVLKTIKQAPKLNPLPVNRSLLCAMLRRAADKDKYVHIDTLESYILEKANKIKETESYSTKRKVEAYDTLRQNVDAFEKASGIDITNSWYEKPTKIGDAVRLIANGDLQNYAKNLERIQQQVKQIYDGISGKVDVLKQLSESLQELNEEQKVA